jgi:hypothetical protein
MTTLTFLHLGRICGRWFGRVNAAKARTASAILFQCEQSPLHRQATTKAPD